MIIDLHFLIPELIAEVFNPATELVIPTGTNEASAEVETKPPIADTKIKKSSK